MKIHHACAAALLLNSAVATALAVDDVRREIRFPDLPGYQTVMCDFHMHTVFSDGVVWPTVRVEEAWREGLDAIALTDHLEYQPHKGDLPTNHNRPIELTDHFARERDILLIRGAEITRDTPPGHHNAIFLDDVDPLDTPDFFDAFAAAASQGAFIFWNHPEWQGLDKGRWSDKQTTLLQRNQLHGIEVANGDDYQATAHRWALEHNLTFLGNSDIHSPSYDAVRRTPTEHRTLTLVFASERSLDGVREALFARRTAVWLKNQLIAREELLAPYFNACLQIHPPHLRQPKHLRFHLTNRCELDLELKRLGDLGPETIHIPAGATALVHVRHAENEAPTELSYEAANFLVAPEQCLKVSLKIPQQAN